MRWQLIFPVWLSANDQVSVLQMRHRPGNSLQSSQMMISATGLKNSGTLREHQAGREQVEEIRCLNMKVGSFYSSCGITMDRRSRVVIVAKLLA